MPKIFQTNCTIKVHPSQTFFANGIALGWIKEKNRILVQGYVYTSDGIATIKRVNFKTVIAIALDKVDLACSCSIAYLRFPESLDPSLAIPNYYYYCYLPLTFTEKVCESHFDTIDKIKNTTLELL